RLLQRPPAQADEMLAAAQVVLIRLDLRPLRLRRRLQPSTEQRLEGVRGLFGDFVLNLEDVVEFSVVALRPEVIAVRSADQLDVDAQPFTRFSHAALENGRHAQLLADLADVLRGALELE